MRATAWLCSHRWSPPAAIALCVASAVGGAWLGWSAPRGAGEGTVSRADRTTPALHPVPSAPTGGDPGSAVETPALGAAPWEDRWRSAKALARGPARDRALAALLTELARTDAPQAFALAAAETDWRLRAQLRRAVLRGWAAVAPSAAGAWALAAPTHERRALVQACLEGAAGQPAAAVDLALQLCAADPALAGDYGHAALAALADGGAFAEAVRFSQEVGTASYPFLLRSAYFQWARHRPAEAWAALDTITDPIRRSEARGEVLAGWAWADAAGLAREAFAQPAGPTRTQALAEALPLWLERYPDEAAAWIIAHEDGPDFDAGVAALAQQRALTTRRPAAALDLASAIADPASRTATQRAIFREWALREPGAARAYLAALPTPDLRDALTSEVADLPPPSP